MILISLPWLCIPNGNKLVNIYITHPERYAITNAKLLTNNHRKYNNHATYRFSYQGKTLEGSDQSILWGFVGEQVTIYFEKSNTHNNGILGGLFFLTIGQWLFFMLTIAYVIYKIIHYAKTP